MLKVQQLQSKLETVVDGSQVMTAARVDPFEDPEIPKMSKWHGIYFNYQLVPTNYSDKEFFTGSF